MLNWFYNNYIIIYTNTSTLYVLSVVAHTIIIVSNKVILFMRLQMYGLLIETDVNHNAIIIIKTVKQ